MAECGCQLSAAFLVVTVCAAVVVDILQWPLIQQHLIAAIAAELFIAFIASGIGRFLGLARARRSLRKTLSAVSGQIDAQTAGRMSWAA